MFKDKEKVTFFYTVSVVDRPSKIKFLHGSSKWTLGWMMCNIQAHLNPRWRLVINQDVYAAFWKQT